MRVRTTISSGLIALTCAATGLSDDRVPEDRVPDDRIPLTAKTYRRFTVSLPAERFRPVGDGIAVPHEAGARFASRPDGTALVLDTDGDGTPETRIDGDRDDAGVRTAFTILRGRSVDGNALRYGVRLRDRGAGWEWAASGAVTGKVGNTRLQIIDQNGNGRFSDVGEDALVVGSGDVACFLSEVVAIDGRLHRLRVASDGSSLELLEYDGPAGRLDLRSGLGAKARLLSCIVRSTDGRYSFDLARNAAETVVPAAVYALESGTIGLGKDRVRIAPGRSRTFVVAADETRAVAWGEPVRAEFRYRRAGDEVAFDPADVRYFGAAGEEYVDFQPFGASPEFVVKDDGTGEEIEHAIFGGC